tara:strand:+ start:968 stop:1108 length:141 start_codon:yes stop_codon:yes gene_type:complete
MQGAGIPQIGNLEDVVFDSATEEEDGLAFVLPVLGVLFVGLDSVFV